MEFFSAYMNGVGVCAGLIIAIGAQNAFVLVQAVRREYHLTVAALCAFMDAILISTGVLGLGGIVASSHVLRLVAGVGGALFLSWFGYVSFKAAFSAQSMVLAPDRHPQKTLKNVVVGLLAVTLLNPHVYLDTVVLLGGISGNYAGNGRYFFGLGAITTSTLWFFLLAFCGSALAPLFVKPRAWQILHTLVGLMVWIVAIGLAFGAYKEIIAFFV